MFKQQLENDINDARSNPTSFVIFVSSHFNFLSPGELRRSTTSPNSSRPHDHAAPRPGQLVHVFVALLNQLAAAAGDLDTRYDSDMKLWSRLDHVGDQPAPDPVVHL